MKPSTAKVKGRVTEQLLVDWLRTRGYPYAERRRLGGTHDRGDIAGVVGVVIQVKSGARIDLAGWVTELRTQVENDGADLGFVVIRPKGKPNPDDWWVVIPLPDILGLIQP